MSWKYTCRALETGDFTEERRAVGCASRVAKTRHIKQDALISI